MKLNKILYISFLAFIISAFAISCSTDFRTIYDEDSVLEGDMVEVPVDVDNSNIYLSGVDAELADQFTLILYPIDGSEPIISIIDSETSTISVKKGEYSAIIFNGSFDNHTGLGFADIDSYETIKVYLSVVDLDSSSYLLYSDSSDFISITDDSSELAFLLTDIFTTVHVTTYVSYINLLSEEDNYVIIDGFASGVYLYNRKPTFDNSISINMPFSSLIYNVGSTLNGYLRGQFKCCGIYESEDGLTSNSATLYLKLLDTESGYKQFECDVTDDIKIVDDNDQVLSVEIPNIVIVE